VTIPVTSVNAISLLSGLLKISWMNTILTFLLRLIRYAFNDYVIGYLFNTEELPVSSFRTDNWEEER
jgi:membrane protein YqaA with SNARE-associated domain